MSISKLTSEIYSLIDELTFKLANKTAVFATDLDIEEYTDEFYDCPIENYGNYTYFIYKIEAGIAYGVETKSYSRYEFKLSELSTDCLLMIGRRFVNN